MLQHTCKKNKQIQQNSATKQWHNADSFQISNSFSSFIIQMECNSAMIQQRISQIINPNAVDLLHRSWHSEAVWSLLFHLDPSAGEQPWPSAPDPRWRFADAKSGARVLAFRCKIEKLNKLQNLANTVFNYHCWMVRLSKVPSVGRIRPPKVCNPAFGLKWGPCANCTVNLF